MRFDRSAFISWRGLVKQIVSEYADVRRFKRKAKEALRKVEIVSPNLKLIHVRGGVRVFP